MIPHSSTGQPWGHPLRAFNQGGSGHGGLGQGQGQYDSPDKSQPSQMSGRSSAVVDLADGLESQGEPAAKRPRLDMPGNTGVVDGAAAGTEARNTPGSGNLRAPPLSWRGRPLWSFQTVIAELPVGENRGNGAVSPPPLPVQPWKTALAERSADHASRSRESSPPPKDVQTTPYRIEVPSVAPVLKGESEFFFCLW